MAGGRRRRLGTHSDPVSGTRPHRSADLRVAARAAQFETVNFGVLALIVLAGLAGPLPGLGRGAFVPVVIDEVLAGVVVGRTSLDAVDLTDPTVQFLSDVGLATPLVAPGSGQLGLVGLVLLQTQGCGLG